MAGVTASPENRPLTGFVLRPRMVGTLLGLRWRLLTRDYRRSVGRIISLIFFVIFMIPLFGSVAFGIYSAQAYFLSSEQNVFAATNILFYVLIGMYIIWVVLPIFQFTFNEGLDVTKLRQYPLSQPELMTGLLFTTLLDVITPFIILLLANFVFAWSSNVPQALAVTGVLLLFYVNMISSSQLILSALLGALKSRRWRDLAIVLATALSLSCSLFFQVVARAHVGAGSVSFFRYAIYDYDVGAWAQYLPPGMAARAIQSIYGGDTIGALGWSGALALVALVIMTLWSIVLSRALVRSEQGASPRRVRQRSVHAVAVTSSPSLTTTVSTNRRPLISPVAFALFRKDLAYYWRDPMYKRLFLSSVYWIVFLFINPANSSRGGIGGLFLYLAVITLVMTLSMNMFGYEGKAMTTLSLFPIRGWHLFLGKNLAVFVLALGEGLLLLGFYVAIRQTWETLPLDLVVLLSMVLVALGASNLIALFLPMRVPRADVGRQQVSGESNFALGFARAFASLGVIVLSAPSLAAATVPALLGHPEWEWFLVPIGVLYSIAVYTGATAIAAHQYYQRINGVIANVVKE